jgi:hypothetical protein
MPGKEAHKRQKKIRQMREGSNSHILKEQLDRIYIRDKGICQLCLEPCIREESSRDHIIELKYCTRAMARDDNNVRLAHITCNNYRSNNPDSPEFISEIKIYGLRQSLADFMPAALLRIMDVQDICSESD